MRRAGILRLSPREIFPRIMLHLIFFLALVFSSCSRDVGPDDGALTITINAAPGGVNNQVADWLIAELPDVSKKIGIPVKFLTAGINDADYKARIALDVKGGRGADVMSLDQFFVPEFADAKFIKPLDEYIKDWPAADEYYPSMRKMGSYRGHVYQIVWNADIRMIFYHRDILRRAKVELPWTPKTWADIIETGRKIKACCPDIIPLQINAGTALDEATTMQGFYMVLLGANGRLYDEDRECWIVDSEPLTRTMEFYRQIYQVDKLADADLQIAPKAREKTFDLFSRGKIAIYIESTWFYTSVLNPTNESWGIADRDERIGWAPMPGGGMPGDPEIVSISGGDGLLINPNTKRPDLAWKLIKELNDLERQKRLFLRKPFTPTRRDLANLPAVEEHKFISRAAREVMPHSTYRPAVPIYPEISFHVQYLTERVALGQLSVEEAIAEYGKAVENIVGEQKVCR